MHRHGARYMFHAGRISTRFCCACPVHRPLLRDFTGSSAWSNATLSEDECAAKPRGRRTKKSIDELPRTFLGPDGTPAAALDPWGGTLGVSRKPSKKTVLKSAEVEPVPKKSSRKRKSTVSEQLTTGGAIPSTTMASSNPGVISPEETQSAHPSTPLAMEIQENLARFPHCILLTRVGQFYESYFDQAIKVAKLLNIKLASKSWGGARVAMAGFPILHLNKYLKVLVQDHRLFVAICDEFMRDRKLGPKGGFDRRVNRIVTPGTLIDEPFLNPYENNYLLAINAVEEDGSVTADDVVINTFGLAWIDVSTGDFYTKCVGSETLQDELVRITPREIVLNDQLNRATKAFLREQTEAEGHFVSYMSAATSAVPISTVQSASENDDLLSLQPHDDTHSSTLTLSEQAAADLLSGYLAANLFEGAPQLASPNHEAIANRMQIDSHTIKALELKETLREGGTTGSLLSVIKRTVTSGGTRLLSRWICSPSASVEEINSRQSLVAFFHARPHLRADIVQSLGQLEDATRILQRFLLGRGFTFDLVAICATIDVWNLIRSRFELEKEMELRERGKLDDEEWSSLNSVISRIDTLQGLASRIRAAVVSEDIQNDKPIDVLDASDADAAPTNKANDRWTPLMQRWSIQPHFSQALTGLHNNLAECLQARDELEKRFQAQYSSPSLTLRSSPGQGFHVHIGRGKRDAAKMRSEPTFIPISSSGSTYTFYNAEWAQLGNRMQELSGAIYDAEKAAFDDLRNDVNAHASEIRRNSRIMDEIDVSISYASLAEELQLVRPRITEDTRYHVVNGRHPTVELGLLSAGRTFVPNTVSFAEDSSLHIITGPNMAGKSTLLRQTALISILAQTGSFVPADSATIGIVDRIFSRVGAKDDLFRNRSTFMVEMLETADILRRATPNSLVIMDEVGRGTTVEDGLAISFATVHHLLLRNRCRTLFATHFHELADLLGCSDQFKGQGIFQGVNFYCTGVDETEDGYFTYSHRLRPGINRDSHGLKAAQLAGMPDSAIAVASGVLKWLRERRDAVNVQDSSELQALGATIAQDHRPTMASSIDESPV